MSKELELREDLLTGEVYTLAKWRSIYLDECHGWMDYMEYQTIYHYTEELDRLIYEYTRSPG